MWKYVMGRIPTHNLELRSTPPLTTRPLQHIYKWQKNQDILKRFGIFAEQNRKWKIPTYLQNYFSGQKGVHAGKIPEYGGKNKSGLLAEKKLAYGRIKNSG